jgi:hypothetical protein
MPIFLQGKQIEDHSIEQSKIKVFTSNIINPNDITTKKFVESFTAYSATTTVNMSSSNLYMNALTTTSNSGYQLACSTHISDIPISNIRVSVNGIEVNVGYGSIYSCVFSPDGIILRIPGTEQQGDFLYWNTDNNYFQLETTDYIDFVYFITI